jgi:hypothetical protein
LLIAGAGLAAVNFTTSLACVGGKVAGGGPCIGCGPTGKPVETTGGTTGTSGGAVQYCGLPDGGTPIPCSELDGGSEDGGPGDAG